MGQATGYCHNGDGFQANIIPDDGRAGRSASKALSDIRVRKAVTLWMDREDGSITMIAVIDVRFRDELTREFVLQCFSVLVSTCTCKVDVQLRADVDAIWDTSPTYPQILAYSRLRPHF